MPAANWLFDGRMCPTSRCSSRKLIMLLMNFSGSANSRPLIVFFGPLSSIRWTGPSGLILRWLLGGSLSANSSGNSLTALLWWRWASARSIMWFQGVAISEEIAKVIMPVRGGLGVINRGFMLWMRLGPEEPACHGGLRHGLQRLGISLN